MPPRRRLDSLNVQPVSRYNLRLRTRRVQSPIDGSIVNDIPPPSAILQRSTTNSRHPHVSIASTRRNNTVSTRSIDQSSIEYMYDRCNEEFYTPDRCVYTNDIPCYTQYNNVIPIDRRYVRSLPPINRRT